ncbi:MAG TPA: Fe-S-containing hydro-lyase [candidate division Zixibacteria bacterium]|nr:Fe-S-containing hydro-lyase [candidate division Zixibacteria bacterium]
MSNGKRTIETPLTDELVRELTIGTEVLIRGTIYTGRDSAHKRMTESLAKGEELPFDPKGQIIYFAGPTPPKPGKVIGSAGPTTSYRMNKYAPDMLDAGLKGMIGKGEMSPEVAGKLKEHTAVYFLAIGGAGALISKSIQAAEVIAYEDLGPEAVRKLTVSEFPAIVVMDCFGGNLFREGVEKYKIA